MNVYIINLHRCFFTFHRAANSWADVFGSFNGRHITKNLSTCKSARTLCSCCTTTEIERCSWGNKIPELGRTLNFPGDVVFT